MAKEWYRDSFGNLKRYKKPMKEIHIGMKNILIERVKERANELDCSVAQYIRSLCIKDLRKRDLY